ncbi:hypothetical protein [Hafnia alvei]|uniref:Pertussis toxin subunit 1 n=1 Tax=Hafnia alvei TaxID=569 RepID=A0A1C6YX31_HAFAL|nr:hypothetical protein [Hafnia alvei]NLS53877.1 hypothetical protein [Hafnia alvei]SCM51423.1 pertussis toxin subunit 1 [Hafnia alvei]
MYKSIKLLLGALVASVMLIQSAAMAAPPKFVYRFDTRPPSDIFVNGFTSWGNNENVFAHIGGRSCIQVEGSERDSAFIATSSDITWSTARALQLSMQSPDQPVYLYRIRADAGFYPGMESLDAYARDNPEARISPANRTVQEEAHEYLALNRILPENIESATRFYQWQNDVYPNSGYIARDTHANNSAFGSQSDGVIHRFTWVLRAMPTVGACFGFFSDKSRNDNSDNVIRLESLLIPAIE